MVATLRHHSQPIGGASRRQPIAARGASRMVAKEPLAARLPKADFSGLGRGFKRLGWPLLLVALGLGTYEGAQRLLPYADRPIARVSVQGELSYISQQAVQERIAPYTAASFFTIDLAGMRAELEQMPWIAHAEVRRVWPDQVSITLEEQLPVARWGSEALLNNQGRAFAPREAANYEHLPLLSGPQRAQQQVMQQYQVLSQLLRPLGFTISSLELREHGSWFISTAQGVDILLGRDHLVDKMRRFASIHDKVLKQQIANIARIDLRYANGLAVAWRAPVAPTAAEPAAVKN
ncbi:cell division protein FtsQ/DivIB [Aquipseudomonas alcaligenes]|uniref:Cell division protein FtsQ n=2 Tax=Aquipseudomonas alcaligenes TaxID=43263 RepID=U2ZP61_AQUA1|nr:MULTISPECIES: cell division protein FtsQ/DivIB [Pseudomonas]TXI31026.1 MAG: cell division protein FtsQ/DivIB [Pseudomonas alcaligenes]GAD63270.1 cell division protein FtsQ [Pseudomonas alcaligenes NBRC 14159]SUD14060.1 cell division protein FtsQ [Pseudomonas alcaligenes]